LQAAQGTFFARATGQTPQAGAGPERVASCKDEPQFLPFIKELGYKSRGPTPA